MSLNVIDCEQRHIEYQCQRLRRREADQEGAHQARMRGNGDGTNIGENRARTSQGLVNHREDSFQVSARCDLRHHPAETLVKFMLSGHDAGKNMPFGIDHRRCSLIARGFDS